MNAFVADYTADAVETVETYVERCVLDYRFSY